MFGKPQRSIVQYSNNLKWDAMRTCSLRKSLIDFPRDKFRIQNYSSRQRNSCSTGSG
ncbi:unnamed protein product, partial [Nesidiocoris tenuis]